MHSTFYSRCSGLLTEAVSEPIGAVDTDGGGVDCTDLEPVVTDPIPRPEQPAAPQGGGPGSGTSAAP